MKAVQNARMPGYAMTDQTHEEGVFGISVPIIQRGDLLVGVSGVPTPLSRVNDASKARTIERLSEAAAELGRIL